MRYRFGMAALLSRYYHSIIVESLYNGCASTVQSMWNRCAIAALSLRYRCAIAAQSLRNPFATVALFRNRCETLQNRLPIATESPFDRYGIAIL
jgi:hypothetical protein